jgi:hypothetical protein
MKNKVLLIAAAMLVSVAMADTADAGLFRNNCGVRRTPVKNIFCGGARIVRGTVGIAARVVTAPVRAVRHYRWQSCNGGWVRVQCTAPSPRAVRANNVAPLEVAPSPPQ